MKKLFVFAIAAVAMTVACQKNQDVNLGTENEGDLVEIRLNSNLVTVETKGIESLEGQELFVYGRSDNNKRQVLNAPATVDAAGNMTLDKTYFYDPKGNYSFYGYCLHGALADGSVYDAPTALTIDGSNDVLLAVAEGTFSAATARNDVHPHLVFAHVLSKFTFAVANVGNTDMTLSDITIDTPLAGTITLTGAQGVAAGTEEGNIDLAVSATDLAAQTGAADPTFTALDGVEALVFPASTYTLNVKLTQEGLDNTRVIPVTVTDDIVGGTQYTFNIKLYSLEKIEITASLKGWGDPVVLDYDTSDLEEVEE